MLPTIVFFEVVYLQGPPAWTIDKYQKKKKNLSNKKSPLSKAGIVMEIMEYLIQIWIQKSFSGFMICGNNMEKSSLFQVVTFGVNSIVL